MDSLALPPKVELHVHLEGGYDGAHLFELARRHADQLPETVEIGGTPVPLRQAVLDATCAEDFLEKHVTLPPSTCTLSAFLAPFNWVGAIVQTAMRAEGIAVLEEVALHFVKRQHASNVIYTELRWCPHLFLEPAELAQDGEARYTAAKAILCAVARGLQRGELEYGITVRQILAAVDFLPLGAMDLARLLRDVGRETGCVAIDVAGGEGHFALDDADNPFLQAVLAAQQAGFATTIHAGEDANTGGTASNVSRAIEAYGATRIGHGYLALTDEKVMQLARRSKTHFECCPTSSLLTGGFAPRPRPWSEHPLRALHERGMSCGLNSDDPLVCGVCLQDEFRLCLGEMGLSSEAMRTLTENAIDAAFCAGEVKAELRLKVAAFYLEVPGGTSAPPPPPPMLTKAEVAAGYTGLMVACRDGAVDAARSQLAAGAIVDARNAKGSTSLIVASAGGRTECVKTLLAANAAVDATNVGGLTALMAAAAGNHTATVEALTAAGADTEIKTATGVTSLILASQKGQSESVGALLKAKADVNIATTDGNTSLLFACTYDHAAIVAQLIAAGADVNARTRADQSTGLMLASAKGDTAVVDALLSSSSTDANLRRKHGITALMLAGMGGHHETVARLVSKGGALAGVSNEEGLTALHLAAGNADAATVAALLGAADIRDALDAPDEDGSSALMLASGRGDALMASHLLAAGAGLEVANSRGWSALMFACQGYSAETVDTLLGAGAAVDAASAQGVTSLLIASASGNATAVSALVKQGAQVEAADEEGRRSLMLAVKAGSKECIGVLLEAAASVDAVAPDGWRSIMFAEARGDELGKELLVMLRAAGAAELSETESALAAGFSEEEAERALQAVANARQ